MEYEVNRPLRRSGRSPNAHRSKHSEMLIIGAGVFGISTLYHLVHSKTPPTSVTILDRTPYPSTHAASTDINKIIRADYSSPFYMNLAHEALNAWQTWPELKRYYHQTGWINYHTNGSDVPKRIRENYKARNHDPTKDMRLDEAREAYGGIFADTQLEGQGLDRAYCNPEAGWCDASAATARLLDEAMRVGNARAQYRIGDVQRLLLKPNKREVAGVVSVSGEVFTADKVLLATGAWTSSIVTELEDQLALDEIDRVEHQLKAAGVCVVHYELGEKEIITLKDMPVIIYGEYGDCQPPPTSRLLKFTNARTFTNSQKTESGHIITVPPTLNQFEVPGQLKQETRDALTSKLLPQFTNRPVKYYRQCWDAVTPSQDHLLTKHPKLDNLFLAVGGSLHSYKFLPTIGAYIVNVLNGQSNGEEKDVHWCWKIGEQTGKGAHQLAYPTRELKDLEGDIRARI